jgi:hypothetical protein
MKVLVIVPLIISIDFPAGNRDELYTADKALRRGDLLEIALQKIHAGPDVELPDADNEGVIFLDGDEYELPDERGQPRN